MSSTSNERTAIVGGGIAGLFCALILRQQNRSVTLFEASGRVGGRIRTIRLDKDNHELNANNWSEDNRLEFYAEFGPMRIETDKQLLLKSLLDYLDITDDASRPGPRLKDFPSYTSPPSSQDPKFDLQSDEVGKSSLELLRTALLRIIAHVKIFRVDEQDGKPTVDHESKFMKKRSELIESVKLAAALQEKVEPCFDRWAKGLTADHYWEIQTRGAIDADDDDGAAVPLHAIGFWNLLSDYLSHDAIMKLQDTGTFYHLLPENPNAAEWLVWWLIGFSIGTTLQGVHGGMECIIDRMVERLNRLNFDEKTGYRTNMWLKRVVKDPNSRKLNLEFRSASPEAEPVVESGFDRVILALPKSGLAAVARESMDAFRGEPRIEELLDSAFAFPMVKTFIVVKKRWWEEENRANRYATRLPTRELHYWKGETDKSKQGLIMAYTDRPASSFWANYVPPGAQEDAHYANAAEPRELPKATLKRLKKKIVCYMRRNKLADFSESDIAWYGIRDWGRQPTGGANHAWRPERKFWVVMRRLGDITTPGHHEPHLHVCGEAYSDYHGFMEGSLRSAAYVLHRILDESQALPHERLPWLGELAKQAEPEKERASSAANCPSPNANATPPGEGPLRVDKDYLQELRVWVGRLDAVKSDDEFLMGRS